MQTVRDLNFLLSGCGTVITWKRPFITSIKLYALFCRYIRYTYIRQVVK